MNKRIQILQEIDRLKEEHCKGCQLTAGMQNDKASRYCLSECSVGKQIQQFGDQLLNIKTEKREIAMAMPAEGNVEEAKRLLKETDLNIPEISRKTGVKYGTVYSNAQKIRKQPEEETAATAEKENSSIALKDNSNHQIAKLKEREKELLEKLDTKTHQQVVERKEFKAKESELEEMIAKQNEEIESLNKQPADDGDYWREKYEKERVKHDHLFKYISLLQEG